MNTFKLTFITTVLAATVALGANTGTPSKEMREEMAATHEKLAACLRTDAPMEQCHELMKAAHQGKMAKMDGHEGMMCDHKDGMCDESCPMHKKMHKGMGKGMKKHHEESSEAKE